MGIAIELDYPPNESLKKQENILNNRIESGHKVMRLPPPRSALWLSSILRLSLNQASGELRSLYPRPILKKGLKPVQKKALESRKRSVDQYTYP